MSNIKYCVGIDRIEKNGEAIEIQFYEYDNYEQAKKVYENLKNGNKDKKYDYTFSKIKRLENGDCEIIEEF